jgi:hypothetical protein
MTEEAPSPQRGDIYRQLNAGEERFVRVLGVGPEEIRIRTVAKGPDGAWINAKRSREAWARRERFDGRAEGYRLWEANTRDTDRHGNLDCSQ